MSLAVKSYSYWVFLFSFVFFGGVAVPKIVLPVQIRDYRLPKSCPAVRTDHHQVLRSPSAFSGGVFSVAEPVW